MVSVSRSDSRARSRNRAQQLVAGGMAQRVVDLLEPVEVNEDQRELQAGPLGAIACASAVGQQSCDSAAP